MTPKMYQRLYNELRSPEDIERLHAETGLDRELLIIVHTQRAQRTTTRKFYKVKAQVERLRAQWEGGMRILQLARMYDFSPVLMGMLILTSTGISRKEFWHIVRGEKKAPRRILREIDEACRSDLTYSPWGLELQRRRGIWGEDMLHKWLDRFNIEYEVESQLRKRYPKTPDCLFARALKFNGTDIHWIESKANFGDEVEFRKTLKRQMIPYRELFGSGMIVYWFGFVSGLKVPDGVHLTSREFFEDAVIEGGHILTRSKAYI